MVFWLGLVAGLMIGWVIEWIIDWRFWRQDLNQSLALERQWRAELAAARAEIDELRKQLASVQMNPLDAVVRRDSLSEIPGVEPQFVQRLNATGVFTFQQLGALTSEQIQQIVQPEAGQAINPEAWLAQAKLLSTQQQQTYLATQIATNNASE